MLFQLNQEVRWFDEGLLPNLCSPTTMLDLLLGLLLIKYNGFRRHVFGKRYINKAGRDPRIQ